jgi:hypothetical protein
MTNFLSGYLTYIAGIGFVAFGIVQFIQGDYSTGIQNIGGGVAIIGGRRAIGKITVGQV